MKTILTIITSRANWVFVGMFLVGGLAAIEPSVAPNQKLIVEGALTVLGIIFHTDTKAKLKAATE